MHYIFLYSIEYIFYMSLQNYITFNINIKKKNINLNFRNPVLASEVQFYRNHGTRLS